MYKEIFIKSWNDLKNNLILFLPDILFRVFMFAIGGIIIYFSGLLPVLNQISESFAIYAKSIIDVTKGSIGEREQALQILTDLISLNIGRLAISLIAFFITNFFVGAGFMCMKFEMINSVVKNRKIKLINVYKLSRKIYWKYILLRIFIALFYVIPFLVFALITMPILFKSPVIGGTLALVLFLIYLIYSIFLVFAFYFAIPILFMRDTNAKKAIKESYYYLKNKTSHVLWVWFITVLIFLIVLISLDRLSSLFASLGFLMIASITSFIGNVANFVFNAWKSVFRFRAYK